jgi:hypothetical protein
MRLALPCLLLALAGAPVGPQRFGKPLAGLRPVSLEQLLRSPVDGQTVRVAGRVDAVCRNKGCWLELKQGDASVHVTFEGYSFFVPKDSAGREVVLEGRVRVAKPAPEERLHLEAEGAAKAAAGVSIEATGVEIR